MLSSIARNFVAAYLVTYMISSMTAHYTAFYDNWPIEYMNIPLRNTGLWPMGARTLTSSTARSQYSGVPIASSPRNAISEELTRSAYPMVVTRRAGAR